MMATTTQRMIQIVASCFTSSNESDATPTEDNYDNYNANEYGYYDTTRQEMALAMTPKVTAFIGIVSSLFIVQEIISDHIHHRSNPIDRVLLFVTLYEILDALGWFLSSWALPSWTGFLYSSRGTQSTCNAQGFLLQCAIGAPISNCILTYFFYLVVVYDYTTQQLLRIEWIIHSMVALYSFGIATMLLFLQQYNPTNQVCWVSGYPSNCHTSIFRGDSIHQKEMNASIVPCERGHYAYLYGFVTFYMIICCIFIVIIILNISMRKFLLESPSSTNDDAKWITQQAFLYSLALLITWGPSTVWSTMHWIVDNNNNTAASNNHRTGNVTIFWFGLVASFCEPLQGLWNMLIFIRNRPQSKQRLKHFLLRYMICIVCPGARCGVTNMDGNNINDGETLPDSSASSVGSSCHNEIIESSVHEISCNCSQDSDPISHSELEKDDDDDDISFEKYHDNEHPNEMNVKEEGDIDEDG